MPKAPLLDPGEIDRALTTLPGWKREGETIVKEPAEAMNHHPDVAIHWNEVTLTLWTHASGGLTHRDFDLARAIEEKA